MKKWLAKVGYWLEINLFGSVPYPSIDPEVFRSFQRIIATEERMRARDRQIISWLSEVDKWLKDIPPAKPEGSDPVTVVGRDGGLNGRR